MKIGIDARLYGTKHGGIGRYIENLIKQLEKIDKKNQYFIFLQKNNFDDYNPKNNNFKKVLANFKVYGFGEQFIFPFLLNKHKLDLVHFTHFSAPILYFKKYIVTIHDLIISHYPGSRATTLNPLFYKIKIFFYKIVIKIVASRAKKVVAVSKYTKEDINKLLKINLQKIEVIYEGVDLPRESKLDCIKVKSDLGIKKEFFLYVGSAYPHKNLELLLQVMKKVDEKYQLVLVGRKNYFYNKLEDEINKLKLENKIILTDYLDDQKLSCLYKSAKLYVFPSLIEGFGLPPIEAQSYGLPVLSSNSSCLPEILGNSAIYFNPNKVDDLKNKLSKIISDTNLREGLIQKGEENIKKYSWQSCAKKTLSLYN
jgi:glycosyltransferase involved in cell wall biosynthesis